MVRWANRKDESYMKIVILDGYTENPGDLSWEGFEALGDLTVYDRTTDHSQIAVRIGDAEIILTNKTPVSREIMGACPKLKYIGLLATGYNVVDVKAAKEAGITVTAVPGAAACITALTISGLSTRRFAFEAFLPTDKKERQAVLNELTEETRTMIIYEAPHRLVRTLELLLATLGDRRIRICRELTKKHETVFATTISAAVEYYKEQEPKGECVLVIEGKSRQEQIEEERQKWEEMSIQEHMDYYMDQGIQKKEAMKMVAKDRGVGKRDIYQALL